MDNAFKFDEKSGGLCSEADYPYHAKQGKKCLTNCTDVPGTIVKTFVDVPPGSKKALQSAITLQPISVAIQANQVSKKEEVSTTFFWDKVERELFNLLSWYMVLFCWTDMNIILTSCIHYQWFCRHFL